ncbi:zinc ribbon domain-containing protein [Undibacterium fentianense]|uniref:Zinc ribbon domain-containing protein n=1 Tax=Undibacterium fentianense TaxID=2828728 RepID=A0A941IDS7_9BURK|nr:zinc ribbon domain-containing protein [Undibacterium fentianense]MBR7798886.1 zinc ribbon domain-containing protein [Undibacterium fentianense]
MKIIETNSVPNEEYSALEQRADYIPAADLISETAPDSEIFRSVLRALLAPSLKTIVGPRGCGKTHMMRYAWITCLNDQTKPFAVYVSFNKYYRLEPLLVSRASPPDEFHAWSLGLVILATYGSLDFIGKGNSDVPQLETTFGLQKSKLESLIAALERNQPLSPEEVVLSRLITVTKVQQLLEAASSIAGRKRTVLLLDDAALTLTPAYLIELLDVVRALKTSTIAPKASVYPGTTEYSPRFHTGQDSTDVFVWTSVEAEEYATSMDQIARCRFLDFDQLPREIIEIFRFAAFGIPRAYLTMLQAFKENPSKYTQSKVNQVIEAHLSARLAEFRSLSTKVPKLAHLLSTGEQILNGMVKAIKDSNVNRDIVQLTVGVPKEDLTPIVHRMFQLLIEAGLIFDAKEVKHGTPERIYRRFIPHGAALLNNRALTSNDAGGTLKSTVEAIHARRAKHPIRKKLEKYVDVPSALGELDFALPPCPRCGEKRVNETQKFCVNCGTQLVAVSTFDACMNVQIEKVPGLTEFQIRQMKNDLPQLQTIRDYLAMQNPVAELLTVYGFGRRRSTRIADVLLSFVDDFLS